MNLSCRWLEAFLDRALDPRDVADRLAMRVAPVDAVEPLHAELADIVVARVEEVRRHPNADRLTLCLVNDGSGAIRHVVCGASNVVAGGWYPYARVGARLPGGAVLEQRKIRGEVSEGMLCSGHELRLGEDHEGILALEGPFEPGASFLNVLELGDHRLLLDVTPNRPDLLGHKGVARELAAAYGIPFRLPALPGDAAELPAMVRTTGPEGDATGARVRIEDSGCGRFLGAVVRGIRVGSSPQWLRRRLEAVGVRAINNVVDATNYVMLELNQPMHAYDLATLRGRLAVARAARAGERLVTLDGENRGLQPGVLVIADSDRVVGIAGVMGGRETEVSEGTTALFLECAWFQPTRVRAARKAFGLDTEASYRFERGADKWNGPEAMRRCLEIVLRAAGGEVAGPPVDVWPEPGHPPRVFLREARVAQVLGIELSTRTIEQTLVAVGATVVAKPEDGRLAVEVPGWRPDLVAEIDLVEEVARQYGYERIPSDLRPFRPGAQQEAPIELAADRVRRGLVAEGLLEAVTLPLGPPDPAGSVELENPLSSDHAHLRRRLLPGLVREVERNWSVRERDIRLFEVGTAFEPAEGGGLPREECHVAAVISGGREPPHWTRSGKASDYEEWDLKGLLESVISLANPGAAVQVEGEGWVARTPDGQAVGRGGRLTADAPRWAAPLFGLEVLVDPSVSDEVRYRPVPVTPAAERDLALVVPDAVPAGQVLDTLRGSAGSLLEAVAVLDEYRGAGVPAGARSIAVRLVFRAPDRTLRDVEVDEAVARICETLERTHGIVLRTA